MNRIKIELAKLDHGATFLNCIRGDGSVTFQRNRDRRAAFFAYHDLRHYAVESVLQTDQGFYGLIAVGWEIAETTGKSARGPLPEATVAIEHLVGMLDADETNSHRATAAELNQYAEEFAARNQFQKRYEITADQLAKIRTLTAELHRRWDNLAVGATMQLWFPQEG